MVAPHVERFVQESEDQIADLNEALVAFEGDPTDEAAMERIFRTAHTLKGNCGAMGYDAASDLAHAVEDLLESIRAGRVEVTPELMDAVFAGVDELEAMVEEVARDGEVQRDPGDVIEELREHAAAPGLTAPTDDEVASLLAQATEPTHPGHRVYHVRLEVAGDPSTHGRALVDALEDAFDLLGTEPERSTVEAGDYDGTFDAAFTSVVDREAVERALDPVDAVANHVVTDATDRLNLGGADAGSGRGETAAGGEESSTGDQEASADDVRSSVEAADVDDLSVDELLDDDDVARFDDLDELAEEVEGDVELDEIGDAGTFDDVGISADDVTMPDEAEAGADASAPADDAAAAADDGAPVDDAGGDEATSAASGGDGTGPGAGADADDDAIQDATAEFQQLKEEVDPVGFDELQSEIEQLEFEEYDSDDEVGFDELLSDDELADDGEFGVQRPDDASAAGPPDEATSGADSVSEPTASAADSADPATAAASEEPAVEAGEPAAGSEEPAVEAEEPAAGGEEPAVGSEEPAVEAEEPAAGSEEPAVEAEEPAAGSEEPAVEAEEPAAGSEEPAAAAEEPAAATEASGPDADEGSEDGTDPEVVPGMDVAPDRGGSGVDAGESGDAEPGSEADATAADLFGGDDGDAAAGSVAGDADDAASADGDVPTAAGEAPEVDSFGDVAGADADRDVASDAGDVEGFGDRDSVLDLDGDAAPAGEADETDPEQAAAGDDFDFAGDAVEAADEDAQDVDATDDDTPDVDAADDDTADDAGEAGDRDGADLDAVDATADETLEVEEVEFDEDDAATGDAGTAAGAQFGGTGVGVGRGNATDFDAAAGVGDGPASGTPGPGSRGGVGQDAGDSVAAFGDPVDPEPDDDRRERIGRLGVPDRGDDGDADGEGSQSIRVAVEQLDDMLNLVEGLVTSRARLRRALEEGEPRPVIEDELDDLEDVTSELQDTVMDVRLVPLRDAVAKLPRTARDVARDQDKRVDFELHGQDVELDRSIVDEIGDPLVHLVRNAVDHGIEPPGERTDAGKPEEGSIEVRARRERDRVFVTVEDDGRGIDPDALRETAVEDGDYDRETVESMADDEVYDLLFDAGFSTAEEVTDVSGRGVGMDVVAETVDRLEGSVSVDSEPGEGTTVTLELPVRLAISDVLFVRVGDEEYGVPVAAVDEIGPVAGLETQDGREVLVSDGGDDDGTEAGGEGAAAATDDAAAAANAEEDADAGDEADAEDDADSDVADAEDDADSDVADAEDDDAEGDAGPDDDVDADDDADAGDDAAAGEDGGAVDEADDDAAGEGESDATEGEREVVRLRDALEVGGESAGAGMLVHLRGNVREASLLCDTVRGQQEVVVKPFQGVLEAVPGLEGATVLGDGDVVAILDPETL